MFSKIAVPLDGSPLAEKSLPYALELANRLNARLLLMRIAELSGLVADTPEHELEIINSAEKYLEEIKQTITNETLKNYIPADRVETVVGYGEAVHEIAELALFEKADLVVLTTHGRTGLPKLVLGSVAFRVLQHSSLPLLMIKPPKPEESITSSFNLYDKKNPIVVTLDGTIESEAILPQITEFAKKIDAPVSLLAVVAPFIPIEYADFAAGAKFDPDQETEARRVEADEYLGKIKDRLAVEGLSNVTTHVLVGNVAETISEFARDSEAALLAMATHARGKLGRVVIGSIAEEVMTHSHLPVFLVRRYYTKAHKPHAHIADHDKLEILKN